MKRLIVDYKKLNPVILRSLIEKFPDGYGDDDVIAFKNHKNETIEALEIRTNDTIYLVKVGYRLTEAIEEFTEEDVVDTIEEVPVSSEEFLDT